MQLVREPGEEPEQSPQVVHPHDNALEHAKDALGAIAREASEYLHMPWPELDGLVGGIAPADLWYINAFSGDGKTTFLTSLVLDGIKHSQWRVYYLGLESRPKVIMTHFACARLGMSAADLLSGAARQWPNYDAIRAALVDELRRMVDDASYGDVPYISKAKTLSAATVRSEARIANEIGANVLVVDHVDHIAGSARSLMDESTAVNDALLEASQEFGFVTLASGQLNLDAIRGDRALRYTAPRENFIKFGNKKREVASGMLGLYRPLALNGVPKDDMAKFRAGDLEPRHVCEPNTMGVVCMKHRLYGSREGQRVYLGVRDGRIVPRPSSLPYVLR